MRIDGSRVRLERTRRAWTQAELAARSSVDVRTVQRLERTGQTSLATVQAIAREFHVDPSQLTDDPVPRFQLQGPEPLPTRGALFWILYVLTFSGVILAGLRMFGLQQWFVLAAAAGVALLVYGRRRHDLRAFGAIAISSTVSLLWYFPLTLPASLFSVALYLLLARRLARGREEAASAGPGPQGQ